MTVSHKLVQVVTRPKQNILFQGAVVGLSRKASQWGDRPGEKQPRQSADLLQQKLRQFLVLAEVATEKEERGVVRDRVVLEMGGGKLMQEMGGNRILLYTVLFW